MEDINDEIQRVAQVEKSSRLNRSYSSHSNCDTNWTASFELTYHPTPCHISYGRPPLQNFQIDDDHNFNSE